MTRVLVTGACGFVGEPVVRQLVSHGYQVTAYDDMSRGRSSLLGAMQSDVRILRGDIRNASALHRAFATTRPEIVVHLAALHFIPDCLRDPGRCLSTNVLGTQTVLESSAACPSTQGFVFASTAAVYEPSGLPHGEDDRCAPTDVYGASKLAAEQLVGLFGGQTGMPCAIARLFNVFGPRETNPHLIPTILAQARRAQVLKLGDLSSARDYVFTEDVASAFGACVRVVQAGRTVLCNIGTGHQWTGEEVVAAIGRELHMDLKVEVDPRRLRVTDRPSLCANGAAAQTELDWVPATTFEEGIRRTAAAPTRTGVAT